MNEIDEQDTIISVTEAEIHHLLNMITYDDYAELVHKLNRRPTFDEYKEAIKNMLDYIPSIQDDSLKGAFDLIGDLYTDNAQCPCDKRSKFINNCDSLVQMVNHK